MLISKRVLKKALAKDWGGEGPEVSFTDDGETQVYTCGKLSVLSCYALVDGEAQLYVEPEFKVRGLTVSQVSELLVNTGRFKFWR